MTKTCNRIACFQWVCLDWPGPDHAISFRLKTKIQIRIVFRLMYMMEFAIFVQLWIKEWKKNLAYFVKLGQMAISLHFQTKTLLCFMTFSKCTYENHVLFNINNMFLINIYLKARLNAKEWKNIFRILKKHVIIRFSVAFDYPRQTRRVKLCSGRFRAYLKFRCPPQSNMWYIMLECRGFVTILANLNLREYMWMFWAYTHQSIYNM